MILDSDSANSRLNSSDNLANKLAAFRRQRAAPEVFQVTGPISNSPNEQDIIANDPPIISTVHTVPIAANQSSPRLPNSVVEEMKDEIASGMKTQTEIASEFGVTQANVHYHKKKLDEENEASDPFKRASRTQFVKETAIEKLMLAMGLLTEDKLAGCKATDLATVASDMAGIVDKVTPKAVQAPSVNLVVYAPKLNDESKYRTVEIGGSLAQEFNGARPEENSSNA